MEALLGDSLPKHFGSGWWSGVLGVLLGAGSFLTVLAFRYPHWLTASQTVLRYPIETMRLILALAIVAGSLSVTTPGLSDTPTGDRAGSV